MSSPYDVQTRPIVEPTTEWTKDVFGEWHHPRYPIQFDPENPPSKAGVNMVYNSATNGATLSLGGKVLMEFTFAELFALTEQSYEVFRDCQAENARLFDEKIAEIIKDEDTYLMHGANRAVMQRAS